MKKKKIIIFITCITVLLILHIFNDKLTLTFNNYLPWNSKMVASGKTICNKKYQVVYNKKNHKLICLEKNSVGFWTTNGGYWDRKNCHSISWANSASGESEDIQVHVLTSVKKNITESDLSVPNTSTTKVTTNIKKLSSNEYVVTIIVRGRDLTFLNDYYLDSVLTKKGII